MTSVPACLKLSVSLLRAMSGETAQGRGRWPRLEAGHCLRSSLRSPAAEGLGTASQTERRRGTPPTHRDTRSRGHLCLPNSTHSPRSPTMWAHTHMCPGVSGRRGTRDPDHTRWRHRPLCGDRLHRGPDTRTPHRHQAAFCTRGLCPPQTQSCLANLETPVSGPSPSSPEQGGWPRWVGGLRPQQ